MQLPVELRKTLYYRFHICSSPPLARLVITLECGKLVELHNNDRESNRYKKHPSLRTTVLTSLTLSEEFKNESITLSPLSQICKLFLTTLVIRNSCSSESLPCHNSCSVHCFSLSCLLIYFFTAPSQEASHSKLVPLSLLDGCNGVETPLLS